MLFICRFGDNATQSNDVQSSFIGSHSNILCFICFYFMAFIFFKTFFFDFRQLLNQMAPQNSTLLHESAEPSSELSHYSPIPKEPYCIEICINNTYTDEIIRPWKSMAKVERIYEQVSKSISSIMKYVNKKKRHPNQMNLPFGRGFLCLSWTLEYSNDVEYSLAGSMKNVRNPENVSLPIEYRIHLIISTAIMKNELTIRANKMLN